jgi:hypothetical protein
MNPRSLNWNDVNALKIDVSVLHLVWASPTILFPKKAINAYREFAIAPLGTQNILSYK